MKIAYLVFAYRNPQLIRRSVAMLSAENCDFFIHVDQKSDITEFSRIAADNVIFAERRVPVYWAEFSGVRAILLLLRQALESNRCYDYFVLLSGSEYPIRSSRYINAFLQENSGLEFMNIVKVPNEDAGKPLSRIDTVFIQTSQPVRRFAMRVMAKLGLGRRDHRKWLGNMEPYAGSTWWALTRDACRYVTDFVEGDKCVQEYFQRVFAPEEAFFHTILGNSVFKSRIRRNLVYEDWSARGARPAAISCQHVTLFEGQEKVFLRDAYGAGELLFARKLSDSSLHLLDRIDQMIEHKEKYHPLANKLA